MGDRRIAIKYFTPAAPGSRLPEYEKPELVVSREILESTVYSVGYTPPPSGLLESIL
jgi:hypothetical protein